MQIREYIETVLNPANAAVSVMRMAGLPVSKERLCMLQEQWEKELVELESYVEGEAAKRGITLKYSHKHGCQIAPLKDFLYGANGLALPVKKYTAPSKTHPKGQVSTDNDALAWYASNSIPKPDDIPQVAAILKIRSISKALTLNVGGFLEFLRPDGCLHAKYNWNKVRTARLSCEAPNLQNIPERSDKDVASPIKSCLVPRVNVAPTAEEWDPRKHGSVGRWDIAGAEAVVRAAMLTALYCTRPDPVAYDYLRLGKDIHSKTASLIYNVPEGTYKKGSLERDAVGKQTFFGKLFGGEWSTVQNTVWEKARHWLTEEEAKKISINFDLGYPSLTEMYERDKLFLGKHGYAEDLYGRRRRIPVPPEAKCLGFKGGKVDWFVAAKDAGERKAIWGKLKHAFNTAANTPTQSTSGTDTLWMLALLYHGEYVELKVPPMWEDRGVLFPEAADWCFHEGRGPWDKPMQVWSNNTVHDSGWFDCGPDYLEPAAKVIYRRCTALPFDMRLKTNLPYRVELQVGPDFGHLYAYNKIASKFGYEPMPDL